MNLIDVLLAEQINQVFTGALREGRDVDLSFLYHDPERGEEVPGGESPAVRLRTPAGQSLLVTPRRITHEVGSSLRDVAVYDRLTGYDWIAREMADKVELKSEHYDRLYLHLRGDETRVLDRLGPAVYPLMTFLGKVLELRSEKVLLRRLDPDVVDLLGSALTAAALGPFFEDGELGTLFATDRGSLQVLAHMWPRLNLASPDLRRTVEAVVEMLVQRKTGHEEAWSTWLDTTPERLIGALEAFRAVVG
jgi:hypothetical protein